jgi:hypothetical protein
MEEVPSLQELTPQWIAGAFFCYSASLKKKELKQGES